MARDIPGDVLTQYRGFHITATYGDVGSRSEGWRAIFTGPNGEVGRSQIHFWIVAENAIDDAREQIDKLLMIPTP